jgi:hypothetical protein
MKSKTKTKNKKAESMTVWAAFELILETAELDSRVGPYDAKMKKDLGEAVLVLHDRAVREQIEAFFRAFDEPKGGSDVH